MKLSQSDLRIIRAALNVAVAGDDDAWDDLSEEELDRAAELLDEISDLLGDPLDEEEEESPW